MATTGTITNNGPRVILGTMTIGGQTNQADATTMLLDFSGNEEWSDLVKENPMIDTAIMYCNGKTEQILGDIISKNKDKLTSLSIATKANPFTTDKNLSPSGLRNQLESSLKSLKQDSVDIFYLHAPDVNNAIEPTLEEVQKLHTKGKIRRFALSNFAAWEVVYIHSYMKTKGYVVPTIYQGMYNAITRQVESELFPALRRLGMSFYAYNPLAGGMLSGKYQWPDVDDESKVDEVAAKANAEVGGRFAGNTFWAKRYRERFQRKEQHQAVELVKGTLKHGQNLADASLRWMRHHSKLSSEDGIIAGASRLSHYHANMESLSAGPLPEEVVKAFDEANRMCESVCPSYARGYSGSCLVEK